MSQAYDDRIAGARKERPASPQHFILQWLSWWKRDEDASSNLRMTREQIATLLPSVPGWNVVDRNGISRLERVFRFSDLEGSLAFAIQVGAIDASKIHPPALYVDEDRVKVSWWTISKGGLLQEDFENAAKTDSLYQTS